MKTCENSMVIRISNYIRPKKLYHTPKNLYQTQKVISDPKKIISDPKNYIRPKNSYLKFELIKVISDPKKINIVPLISNYKENQPMTENKDMITTFTSDTV